MKIKHTAIILITALLMLSGCGGAQSKAVKIDVMGDPELFYPGFKSGIERAVRDLNEEYADTGYTVECHFKNSSSYEDDTALVDSISRDKSITGIIGTYNMETNKTAAYICNDAGKLFVVPYFLYDSVYENNNYTTIFSMCNSGDTVGRILRTAAEASAARKWAVCSDSRDFEVSEMNGFLKADGSVQIVDCVDTSAISEKLSETCARWELLGVEGVVIFTNYTNCFDILKKLKAESPTLIVAGDTAFDESSVLMNDPELIKAMTGFIIADEFSTRDMYDYEMEKLLSFYEEYNNLYSSDLDLWYLQGYNAVRMIADTAIQNNTTDSSEIARLLHENGYNGILQDFTFDEKGSQTNIKNQYYIMNENGIWEEYIISEKEDG